MVTYKKKIERETSSVQKPSVDDQRDSGGRCCALALRLDGSSRLSRREQSGRARLCRISRTFAIQPRGATQRMRGCVVETAERMWLTLDNRQRFFSAVWCVRTLGAGRRSGHALRDRECGGVRVGAAAGRVAIGFPKTTVRRGFLREYL